MRTSGPRSAVLILALALGACASDPRPKVANPGATLGPIQSARAHATVAQDLEASGDPRGAIRSYEMARDADPVEYQWVSHRLGLLHAAVGDAVASDIEFRRAWRLNPNDPAIRADWSAHHPAHDTAETQARATGY